MAQSVHLARWLRAALLVGLPLTANAALPWISSGFNGLLHPVNTGPVIEDNVLYPGNDLGEGVDAKSPTECLELCKNTTGCWAFSYAKMQSNSQEACYLKGIKPRASLTKISDVSYASGYINGALNHLDIRTRPGISLYCFVLFRPGSEELDLVKEQYNSGTGVFGCDEYGLFSNKAEKILPGIKTSYVDSDLHCKKGGAFGTALNHRIFLMVWDRVLEMKRFEHHDWVVKVDPDAVFFASRLHTIVTDHHDEPEGVYLSNCEHGLRGPLEVMSRNAVRIYKEGKQKCISYMFSLCVGSSECKWSDDSFMEQCLRGVLQVKREVEPEKLLVDEHCLPPKDWRGCQNGKVVALHSFKTLESYRKCQDASMAAAKYTWASRFGWDLPGLTDVETLNAQVIGFDSIKRHVEQKGYIGFVVVDGMAHVKAAVKPLNWLTWPSKAARKPGHEVFLLGPSPAWKPTTAAPTTAAPAATTTATSTSAAIKETSTTARTTMASTQTSTTSMTTTSTTLMTTMTTTTLHVKEDKVDDKHENGHVAQDKKLHSKLDNSHVEKRCFMQAEPVNAFWNQDIQEMTYHMGKPESGEQLQHVAFYAFSVPVIGSEPIFNVFHAAQQQQATSKALFWAFKSKTDDAEPIWSYWQPLHERKVLHLGGPKMDSKDVQMPPGPDWLASHHQNAHMLGSEVHSGDIIFLKDHMGNMLDVEGDSPPRVRSRWPQQQDWQAMVIVKETPGPVATGDTVSLRAHTGKFLELNPEHHVRASLQHFDASRAFIVEGDHPGKIHVGDQVTFRVPSGELAGKYLEVQGGHHGLLRCRWSERGQWQHFMIFGPSEGWTPSSVPTTARMVSQEEQPRGVAFYAPTTPVKAPAKCEAMALVRKHMMDVRAVNNHSFPVVSVAIATSAVAGLLVLGAAYHRSGKGSCSPRAFLGPGRSEDLMDSSLANVDAADAFAEEGVDLLPCSPNASSIIVGSTRSP